MSSHVTNANARNQASEFRFDICAYEHRPLLTEAEKTAIRLKVENRGQRRSRPEYAPLGPLLQPLEDCWDATGCTYPGTRRETVRQVLVDMHARGTSYRAWSQKQWEQTLDTSAKHGKSYVAVAAYLVGGAESVGLLRRHLKPTLFTERVFGEEALAAAFAPVSEVAGSWGYDLSSEANGYLRRALCHAMLLARSPRLEDITAKHLEIVRSEVEKNVNCAVGRLWRILASMGIVEDSLQSQAREPGYVAPPAAELFEGVPPTWLRWCEDWLEHCTLRSRRTIFWRLLHIGRWLAAHHSEADNPERWTTQLAASYVAAVDEMKVGQWSSERSRLLEADIGEPLGAAAKSNQLYSARRFFRDLQEWEWIPVRFNPDRCLRTPSSISRLIGPDPKVVDSNVWPKLVKAALDLDSDDLPRNHRYPVEMVRALAALWVCSGLRSDEMVRLRVGCIRRQEHNARIAETGEVLEKGTVCFLDVPVNKTSTAFTNPVPPELGARIENWERLRPKDQKRMLDKTTGERVHFLFSFRNRQVPKEYFNRSLIPLLCRVAGVPQYDARGKITCHRSRASLVSQLVNGPEEWPLTDVQALLGHASPASTLHYVQVDPTRLAKKFADSSYVESNVAAVEVLVDVESIAQGKNANVLYYDLGHGLCANPYWEKCPVRMACVKCPMYVPGEEAQYVRAKKGIRRMLETVPMTDAEQRAAEGDEEALNEILSKGANVPIPTPPEKTIVPLGKKRKDNSQTSHEAKD